MDMDLSMDMDLGIMDLGVNLACSGVSLDFLSEFRAKCFWTLRQSMLKLL